MKALVLLEIKICDFVVVPWFSVEASTLAQWQEQLKHICSCHHPPSFQECSFTIGRLFMLEFREGVACVGRLRKSSRRQTRQARPLCDAWHC